MRNTPLRLEEIPSHGMPTPWGPAQHSDKLAQGVYNVSTSSHGGILVGQAVARERMTERAQEIGEPFGRFLAFEEDCDWAIVALEMPDAAERLAEVCRCDYARLMIMAVESAEHWNADYFASS
jgi:hypothetical protein